MYLAAWREDDDGVESWMDPIEYEKIGDGATHWQPLPLPPV